MCGSRISLYYTIRGSHLILGILYHTRFDGGGGGGGAAPRTQSLNRRGDRSRPVLVFCSAHRVLYRVGWFSRYKSHANRIREKEDTPPTKFPVREKAGKMSSLNFRLNNRVSCSVNRRIKYLNARNKLYVYNGTRGKMASTHSFVTRNRLFTNQHQCCRSCVFCRYFCEV